MYTAINRALIYIYVLWRNLCNRLKRKEDEGELPKTVLIIFQQAIGDAVIFSAALPAYTKLFPAAEGWTVKLLCRPATVRLMREVLPLPGQICMEEVDFGRSIKDFRYFRSIVRTYSVPVSMTVTAGTSPSAELLSAALPAKRRVGLLQAVAKVSPFYMALLQRLAYSEPVRPPKERMTLLTQRDLLRHLGAADYEAKLPVLLPQEKCVSSEHYAVVCPGASVAAKMWPGERYVAVIDALTERFGMDVYLCGSREERPVCEEICGRVRDPEKVRNRAGELTFGEWSGLIQHADLMLGNDSASAHLAAAARVRAVCIAGAYDKGSFFPYQVDRLEEGDRLPVTVSHTDWPCAWCWVRGYAYGYRNPACQKAVRAGKCALCIESVTVQEVLQKVGEVLQ